MAAKQGDKPVNAVDPLKTEPMLDFAKQLEEWWCESRDKQAVSRAERFRDHDYYDHDQITPEDMAVYEERGQAPVVLNLTHGAIDWLTGTERRTRVDWTIEPRGPEDEQGAKAQTQTLKYVSDANRAGWERSRAFKDGCISGVGFVEEFLRKDKSQEPVGYGYCDWRYLWWDPYSRDYDFGDARYFHRVKFADLDRSIAMFPKNSGDLRATSVCTIDDDFQLMDSMDGVPAMYALSNAGILRSGSASNISDRYARRRVRLIETWYPRTQVSKEILAEVADTCDLHGLTFDANNSEMKSKLDAGQISLTDSLTTKMHLAIWSPGIGILQHGPSPYRHNQVPFTAAWCYRHHRDGSPYGFVRGMRDAQDEYNKRRAKALYAASVQRVMYEDGAFADEDDETEGLEQISRMNGEVRLAAGGLEKIKVESNIDVGAAHIAFQAEAKEHIYEGQGITRENLGQNTNAISGRAIVAKQQQGAVATAEVFDLFRLMIEISGQKLLEITKQGMSNARQIRVLGGNEGLEWLGINQPRYDEATGKVVWDNDILNTLADFKVASQDFRETLRMAMAESLFEVIGKMPPEVALQLIDLAVELTDLPNKAEFIARIRKVNGMTPTPVDPAQAEADAATQAAAAEDAALQRETVSAKAASDRAGAELKLAQAKNTVLDAKTKALTTAGLVAAAVPLAQSADDLYAGATATPPQPVPAGVIA